MKFRNILKPTILVFILLTTSFSFAQQNVVKLGLVDLLKINLSYERAINQDQSLQLNFAFYRPRNLPEFLIPDELDNRDIKSRFFGYSIIPEYRFYISEKESPRGFYISAYLKYSNYSASGSDYVGKDLYKVKGTFSSIGLGAQFGAQWILSDAFTIDWYFIGIEIDRDALSLKYTAESANSDFQDVKNTIESIYSSVPFLGAKLKRITGISTGSNYLKAKVPWFMPDIRAGISIGYAF